jgi:crossover junction endodeoxyribonuclease RuvC
MPTPTVLDPAAAGETVIGLDLSLTATGVAAINLATAALSTAVHESVAPAVDTLNAHTLRHRALADGVVSQVVATNPALAVVEGLQFSVKEKDSSLTRRGFLWWAVIEGLCAAGVPIIEAAPSQIKQIATGRGNAGKDEMVAAYVTAWPHAERGPNIRDRADAAFAAALGIAWLGVVELPFNLTVARRKPLGRLARPSLPPRTVRSIPPAA